MEGLEVHLCETRAGTDAKSLAVCLASVLLARSEHSCASF